MKRLGALVLAVALVAGAVVLRRSLDGGGDGGTGGDGASGTTVVDCSPALADACRRLGGDGVRIRVRDDAATAAALLAATPDAPADLDGWLTVSPWPATVAQQRQRGGGDPVLGRPTATLGRSPATVVMRRDRATAAGTACGGAVTWACLGSSAGEPWTELGGPATWGTFKPGLPPPGRADGSVVLAQAAASQLGTTAYAANDFDDDPAFAPWFDQLVGAAKGSQAPGRTPLQQFLVVPASLGAVGALESQAGPAVARSAAGADTAVIYPEPVVTADVVLAPTAGTDARSLLARLGRDRVAGELARTGWRVPGQDAAPGVGGGPPLPARSGMPAPGVLEALLQRWVAVP